MEEKREKNVKMFYLSGKNGTKQTVRQIHMENGIHVMNDKEKMLCERMRF